MEALIQRAAQALDYLGQDRVYAQLCRTTTIDPYNVFLAVKAAAILKKKYRYVESPVYRSRNMAFYMTPRAILPCSRG